ncbi:MAG: tyrosine-type recombinase/integrase [Planctomycetota bacterium]
MQIQEALAAFQAQLDADGRSPHTRKQYARHAAALGRWLARTDRSTDLAQLDHRALAEFVAAPEARDRPDGKRKKATSTNALRTSMRCLFAFLADSGLLPGNPARLLRRARCSPPPPRALQPDDEARIMAAIDADRGPAARRDRTLIVLLIGAGLRIAAALQLQVEDLDLDQGTARIARDKNDREHEVVLAPHVVTQLRALLGDRRTGPLFEGQEGRPLTVRHAQRRFTDWLRRAGVTRRVTLHGLRHAFGSRLLAHCGNLRLVQRAMGHRSITSTTIYTQVDVAEVRKALGNH